MSGHDRTLLAVGGYTPEDAPVSDGPPGLTTWWWDGGDAITPAGSANLASPSFVCWHPTLPVLYAVSELDSGAVTTLRVADDGALDPVASAGTGGSAPCWVTTDPAGRVLLIANYGSGSAAMFTLDRHGLPVGGPTVVQHHGSGPVAERQQGPHVHQLMPTAHGTVLASDLGIDRIVEYRIDTQPGAGPDALRVSEVDSIAMPAGSGPRHIALAGTGPAGTAAAEETGFVTGELDGTVTAIRWDGARWSSAEQVPCSGGAGTQPSHVDLAGDRWLLVANRGTDTLAVLDVADGLTIRHEIATGGNPRHFLVVGEQVLVACQDDDAVERLTLDAGSGTLTRTGTLTAPASDSPLRAPSCLATRRRV